MHDPPQRPPTQDEAGKEENKVQEGKEGSVYGASECQSLTQRNRQRRQLPVGITRYRSLLTFV